MSRYWVIRQAEEVYWTGQAFSRAESRAKRYSSRKEAVGDLDEARGGSTIGVFVSGPWKDEE